LAQRFVFSQRRLRTIIQNACEEEQRQDASLAKGKTTRWAKLTVRHSAKVKKRTLSRTVSPYPSSVAPSFNHEPTSLAIADYFLGNAGSAP
jgi:hypothetical protein